MNDPTGLLARANARLLPLRDECVDLIVMSPPYWRAREYTDKGESLANQIGSEAAPQDYLEALFAVTAECRRVLKPTGSIFVNLGDSYVGSTTSRTNRASHQPPATRKSLHLLPERYRVGCVDRLGLIARAVIIWEKTNGMPESVTDRVRRSHEDWVHLTKELHYFSSIDQIREPASGYRRGNVARATPPGQRPRQFADDCNPLGRSPGSVWSIATEGFRAPEYLVSDEHAGTRMLTPGELWRYAEKRVLREQDLSPITVRTLRHHAAFPLEWPRRLILGFSPTAVCVGCGEATGPSGAATDATPVSLPGCPACSSGSRLRPAVVLDPMCGTGTVPMVAQVLGRTGIGFDLSADYLSLARWRITDSGHSKKALDRTWNERHLEPRLFEAGAAAEL